MSSAPRWVANLVWFLAVIGCAVFVILANPVYERLRKPAIYPIGSTSIIALIVAAVVGAAWWIFVVPESGHTVRILWPGRTPPEVSNTTPSPTSSPSIPTPEAITPDNVESHLKEWLDVLTGGKSTVKIKKVDHPGTYFAFDVLFDDRVSIGISRVTEIEGRADQYIVLSSNIVMSENDQKVLDGRSELERDDYARTMLIEAARSKMDIEFKPPYHLINARKVLPIKILTGDWFLAKLHELRMEDDLLLSTQIELLRKLKTESTITPTRPIRAKKSKAKSQSTPLSQAPDKEGPKH